MIRINLLSEKRIGKTRGYADLVRILVIVNLLALLVAGALAVWIRGRVSELKEESAANKTVVEGLSKKINEVKRFEKLNKELEERSALIEGLRKNQSVPVRVLDDVSALIPEGVWLDSLVFNTDSISLEGNAFTNIDVVTFIDNLKRSPDLSDVYLEESREIEIEKIKVYRFKVNFKVKV